MVEFLTLVKNTFRKLQLHAEVAMLDRDATNRQRAFGVEIYDLIESQKRKTRKQIEDQNKKLEDKVAPEQVEGVLKVFQAIENEIRGPLEACRKEVGDMEESKPGFPEIMIQRRKEEFGIEIWPIVSKPSWLHESLEHDMRGALAEHDKDKDIGNLMNNAMKGVIDGTKKTITKAIGKLSPEQREVETLVDTAKRAIKEMEDKQAAKAAEIEALVAGGTTLECC